MEQARTTIIGTSATIFGQGDLDNQNNVGTQARELGLICSFDQLAGRRIRAGFHRQALFVILAAVAGMLACIAFRFEWIYGVAAIPAVLRDTVITIGLFPIFNREIAVTVIAALLTLASYWMSDTIVVFERIRENLKLDNPTRYTELVNASIDQTMSRTVLTSGLTFLTAMSLWLFAGPVLQSFSLALVIGIMIGTYSPIFIARPVVALWNKWQEDRKQPRVAVALAWGSMLRRVTAKALK